MAVAQPIGASEWSGRKAPNDRVFPSMSTLAGNTLASPALTNWAIEETAKRTVQSMGTLAHKAVSDPDGVVEEIKQLRWQRPDGLLSASARGTFLHEVMENWLHGEAAPVVAPHLVEQLQPSIDRLMEWFIANKPEMIASEMAVFNLGVGAAGRFDGIIKFGAGKFAGETMMVDLKTKDKSKTARGYDVKPYGDSVCLQMAGYRWAEAYAPFIPRTKGEDGRDQYAYGGRAYLLNDSEEAVLKPTEEAWERPSADLRTAVILLTPDWCRTFEIDTGPDVLQALKDVRAAWQWKFVTSKDRVSPAAEIVG